MKVNIELDKYLAKTNSHVVDLEARYRKYFEFLNTLFDKTGGSPIPIVNMWEIGREIGTGDHPSIETQNIVHWLTSEGLIKGAITGGGIVLTHRGIKEVEQARMNPEKSTEHFPQNIYNVITNFGSMGNVQQGNIRSTQTIILNETQRKNVVELVSELRTILAAQEESEQKEELEKVVQMLEIEATSKKPRMHVARDLLNTIAQKAKEYAPLGGIAIKIGVILATLI